MMVGQSFDSDFDRQSKAEEDYPCEADTKFFLEFFLYFLSLIILVVAFPLSIVLCTEVVLEYERLVVFRLGRITNTSPRGPGSYLDHRTIRFYQNISNISYVAGIYILLPCIDRVMKVDLRTFNFTIPISEVVLKDSIPISVEAVVWCKVCSVISAVSHTEDYWRSSRFLAAANLRKLLGTKNLTDVISDKSNFSDEVRNNINDATVRMGIRIERVEIKSIRLPPHLRRAMAIEGITLRESASMAIFADGERDASHSLTEAASVLDSTALQMRYMQVLNSIQMKTELGSTLFFPVPLDFGFLFDPPAEDHADSNVKSDREVKLE